VTGAPLPHGTLLAQDVLEAGGQPFETWTAALPYRRGVVIWARNTSPDTVVITQVQVTHCLNIGAGCGVTHLNVALNPGDSGRTITIRPRLWDDRYVYQLSWQWTIAERPSP